MFVEMKNKLLVKNMLIADSFKKRLIGLLGYREMPDDMAMILCGCHSIHTVGMKFPIDAVFLDQSGVVLSTFENMKPLKYASNAKAVHTLEISAGLFERMNLTVGDRLFWNETGLYQYV